MEKLSDTSNGDLHDYLLEPVSAEAKISRNCQSEPLKSHQTPRISCDLLLDKIPLTLTDVSTLRKKYFYIPCIERIE